MAAISITAANVQASSAATLRKEYNAGATITAGQAVYLNASNVWVLADSDAAGLGNAIDSLIGIATNGASTGQPLTVCTADTAFTLGGTMTNGKAIYLFTTPGAVSEADIPTTAAYPVVLGVAKSTTVMNLRPVASGVVI